MSRYYFDHEQRECYDKGREDERNRRSDYEHDRYSHCPCDEAYFEGRREQRRDEERHAEERAQEEQEERHQYEMAMQRKAEEDAHYDQMYEDEMRAQQQEIPPPEEPNEATP